MSQLPMSAQQELDWWRHFQTKCFNRIPVGRYVFLGERFKIMISNPETKEWEDVWQPKGNRPVGTSTADSPQ